MVVHTCFLPIVLLGSPSIGNSNSQYSILTGASLALRLGELISPEDEQQLTSVVQAGQGNDGEDEDDVFANVRSNKSHSLNHTVRALLYFIIFTFSLFFFSHTKFLFSVQCGHVERLLFGFLEFLCCCLFFHVISGPDVSRGARKVPP